ncbi:hypothetical protein CHS0354_028437 [Potamilus streckersoni]|uniref:Meiosis inhibitor protein 1 n=1 Tax=Potamilus streckersoni TaxID=2493646 RepID=A0AAE0VV87_9BIVA|nr:hypothetical protein CHS0354_028437 [Potamilus streckersoni]
METWDPLGDILLLKLVYYMESEELVSFILDFIAQQVQLGLEHKTLLPHYTLLGKLLYQIPSLTVKLLMEYEQFLLQVCSGMTVSSASCSQNENIQSSIAYICINMWDKEQEHLISPRLRRQVYYGTLLMLSDSQLSQSSLMTALELLKKLLQSDDGCHILMTLTLDGGVTLLSSLKKLLLNKKYALQAAVAQILSTLLSKPTGPHYAQDILDSDLAEFLFEALHTQTTVQLEMVLSALQKLAGLDQFYKRCHAMYGVDSILRALTTSFELKNTNLLKQGFQLLGQILESQPADIPLFLNSSVVKRCLFTLTKGSQHHQLDVYSSAITAATGICRKEYLLLPVPFQEIGQMVQSISKKVWDQLSVPTPCRPHLGRRDNRALLHDSINTQMELLITFQRMLLSSCRLATSCSDDPATCESNFAAPGEIFQGNRSTLKSIKQLLAHIIDQNYLPLVLMYWDRLNHDSFHMTLEILCQLHDLDLDLEADIFIRLCQSDFLVAVIDNFVALGSGPLLEKNVHAYLRNTFNLIIGNKQDMANIDIWLQSGLNGLHWRIAEIPKAFAENNLSIDTLQIYLFVLYLSSCHGNVVLPAQELLSALTFAAERQIALQELCPLSQKHYIFLLAWCCTDGGQHFQDMTELVKEAVITSLKQDSPRDWSSHSIILLKWCFSSQVLATVAGEKMLLAWLELETLNSMEKQLDVNSRCLEEESESSGCREVVKLCSKRYFWDALLNILSSGSDDHIAKVMLIFESHLQGIRCVQETSAPSFSELENSETFPAVCTPDSTTGISVADIPYMKESVSNAVHCLFLSNYIGTREHNLCAQLQLLLQLRGIKCVENVEEDQFHINIKVLCQVLNLLGKAVDINPYLEEMCLKTLHSAVCSEDPPARRDNKLCPLILQNEHLLRRFESCLTETTGTRYCLTCDVITVLVQSTNDVLPVKTIDLDLKGVIRSLVLVDLCVTRSNTRMLGALLGVGLQSPLIKLQSELMTVDFRTLYTFLQQLILQDLCGVREQAVFCCEKLLTHLMNVDPNLGTELLGNPWNEFLLDILLQLSLETGLIHSVVKFVDMFFGHEAGLNIMKSNVGLISSLVKSLLRADSQEKTKEQAEHIMHCISEVLKNFTDLISPADRTQLESLKTDLIKITFNNRE